jgi:hypothetical protein
MLFSKKFIFFSFLEIVTKAYPFFANTIVLFEHTTAVAQYPKRDIAPLP